MTTVARQRTLRRLVDRLLALMGWISALLIFLMMTLTFADVVGRYLFSAPIFGAAEVIQFLLAMSIFAGMSLVNAEDSHVSVELFDHYIRHAAPALHKVLVQGVSVLVMGTIVWEMFQIARDSHAVSSSTIVLEWPLWIAAGTITLFTAISFVVQLISLLLPHPDTQHDMDELL